MVIFLLVIMGELCVLFSLVDLVEKGDYVNMFFEIRVSECLIKWMFDNGGLVSKLVELIYVNIMN